MYLETSGEWDPSKCLGLQEPQGLGGDWGRGQGVPYIERLEGWPFSLPSASSWALPALWLILD